MEFCRCHLSGDFSVYYFEDLFYIVILIDAIFINYQLDARLCVDSKATVQTLSGIAEVNGQILVTFVP